MTSKCLRMSILILLASCASIPAYSPVVDPASIADQSQYVIDSSECEQLTNQVDYSDEEAIAALAGGAVGGAAVVGATAVVLGTTGGFSALAAGATLAPVVWPLLAAGVLIGAGANKRKTNAREQELRAIVWNHCLAERGYVVLSESYVP